MPYPKNGRRRGNSETNRSSSASRRHAIRLVAGQGTSVIPNVIPHRPGEAREHRNSAGAVLPRNATSPGKLREGSPRSYQSRCSLQAGGIRKLRNEQKRLSLTPPPYPTGAGQSTTVIPGVISHRPEEVRELRNGTGAAQPHSAVVPNRRGNDGRVSDGRPPAFARQIFSP